MGTKRVDPTEVFGRNVANYDYARASYETGFAEAVLDAILHHKPRTSSKRSRIIDMGAGTGQLGKAFLDLKCDVVFVEPNPKSVEFLREHFGNNPHVQIVSSKAHNTELPDKYADVITIGDAAHWIDAEATSEFSRILKPEGKVAAFARFWSQGSPVTEKIHGLLIDTCEEYVVSPNQILRDVPNLRRRLGHHLVNDEKNAWYGYSYIREYSQSDLVDYFRSISSTATFVEKDEIAFRKNVVAPLWDFAARNNLLSPDGKLKIVYEINALYGGPRKRLSVEKSNVQTRIVG